MKKLEFAIEVRCDKKHQGHVEEAVNEFVAGLPERIACQAVLVNPKRKK